MPQFSVKKPLTVFVAALAVLILGIVAYTRMTPDLLPNMDFPYVIIMTTDPGASPEAVEKEITRPMEQSMATLDGIKNLTSTSSDSYSLVILEFEDGTNLDTIGIDIQQKISVLEADWDETVGTPYVLKINPSMLPVAMAAVAMDGVDIYELSDFVEEDLLNRLEGVSGVASVTVSGQIEEQLHVVISQEKIDVLNEKVAAAINDQMDEAAQKLKNAKAQINSAMSNLGNVDFGDIVGGSSGSDVDTSEIDEQIADRIQERTRIQATISELTRIKNAMSNTSNANSEEIKKLEKEVADYDKQIEELNGKISALNAKITEQQNIRSEAQKELDKMGEDADPARKAELEKTVSDCTAKISEYTNERSTLQSELVTVQTSRAASYGRLQQLKAESEPLSKEDAQKQLDNLGLGITVDEIDAEIARQNEKLAEVERQISNLQAAREAMINNGVDEDSVNEAMSFIVKSVLQMSSAVTQIDLGLSTIESSRADALAGADLNSILSLETVSGILYAQNFSMPAGYVEQDGVSYMVSVGDNFASVEELENLMLFDFGIEGLEPIYLKDVADVFVLDNSGQIFTRLNDDNGIMLSFEKQSNYATAEVAENIRDRFDELEAQYPGLQFLMLMDQGEYIEYVVASILESLLSGALFSVLVLLLFLKDIRPTVITLVSIPLSLMLAITLMYFTGITLNVISLAGLAISVGMLVDNSVVVIENIYRLRAKGANVVQAAVSGAQQVLGAVTASTLTTICVFLPIVFVEGLTKDLFTDLALTLGYTLMASLLVAITLVPAMAYKLLRDDKPLKKDLLSGLYDKYRPAVAWCLDHKAIVLGVSVALLVGSAGLALMRGYSFMPSMDSNTVTITVTFEDDTEWQDAVDITDEIIDRVLTIDDVETLGATMGGTSLLSMGSSGGEGAAGAAGLRPEDAQARRHRRHCGEGRSRGRAEAGGGAGRRRDDA